MKRSPTRVIGVAPFRRIAMVALLVGALTIFGSCDRWVNSTWINETDVPVYITNNNNPMTALRPHEKESGPGGFYLKGDPKGPPSYTIKAYEFLPGKGDLPGWYDEQTVFGGQGELVFCKTYPREEIEAMNYAVTITRNVFPGQTPPDCPP